MHQFPYLFGQEIVPSLLLAIIVLLTQTVATERENPIIVDLGLGFEKELQYIFNNNIELTQQVLQLLDSVPISDEAKKYAIQFVGTAPTPSQRVLVKTETSPLLIPADDIVRNGCSVMRAVLARYLLDLKALGKTPEMTLTNCGFLRSPDFFNCCDSCCPPCKAAIKLPKFSKSANKLAIRKRKYNKYRKAQKWKSLSKSLSEYWPYEDWFRAMDPWNQHKTPEHLTVTAQTFLDHYGIGIRRKSLKNFLISTQTVNGTSLGLYYYELFSAVLAGLNFQIKPEDYVYVLKQASLAKQETGLPTLIMLIILYANNYELIAECGKQKYCLKVGLDCSQKKPGECVGCLDCKSFEGLIRPKTSKRPEKETKKDENNHKDSNLVDFEKLRIDYDRITDMTDVVSKSIIENDVLACNSSNDVTCQFRSKCGEAPHNGLTSVNKSSYVVNGEDSNFGEWPSFATFKTRVKGNRVASCGGTLISDRHILTAAHCVYGDNAINKVEKMKVILGEHNVSYEDKYEIIRKVSNVCVSKKYDNRAALAKDDWAVLTLNQSVELNDYIQPACLPFEPLDRLGKAAKCFLVGAGLTGFELLSESLDESLEVPKTKDIIQKLRVEQVSCKSWRLSDLDRSRECYSKVGRQKGDSCTGDSGGPVLCLNKQKKWTVVASVSFGTVACDDRSEQAWVGVYSRLRTLLKEIKDECLI